MRRLTFDPEDEVTLVFDVRLDARHKCSHALLIDSTVRESEGLQLWQDVIHILYSREFLQRALTTKTHINTHQDTIYF